MKKRLSVFKLLLLAVGLFSLPSLNAQVTRQPYLQIPTPGSMVISWQSGTGVAGEVRYGTTISSLSESKIEAEYEEIYHEVELTGLTPSTKYYYSVDGSTTGTEDQYFITPPEPGSTQPVRFWVISDFGQTNSDQNERRRETVAQWKSFNNGSYHADLVLSLGDQTEDDSRYQLQHNYFNLLENVLKNSPLYTANGNHDNHDTLINYLSTFALPAKGEAGGVASGTEKYYSFDYANIHVVVLSTEIEDDEGRNIQTEWLKKDLKMNKQDWLIACMHRPFSSGGWHNTDVDEDAQNRRNDWIEILESNGLDLVLQGHNHIYERSYLMHDVVGNSSTFTDKNIINKGSGREDAGGAYVKARKKASRGAVYVEVPGGGVANKYFTLLPMFPVHYNGSDYEGSVVVDVNGNRMDVKFLCDELDENGSHIWDYFTIIKK
jgi:predicted phosphodiesterase